MAQHRLVPTAIATAAAFGTYFAMYGFRKPFTAATYDGETVFGADLKTVLVTAQVLGYTVSKFVGIRVVSQLPAPRRATCLLLLVGFAELALLGFALVPAPWNALCLFANGLPLGMVFGLVLGFLEGRRLTEAMTAGLCASFILASGVVKSVGALLLAQGVPEAWMPVAAGAVFALPLVGCVLLLERVPPPDAADVAARRERAPMTAADRRRFFRRHGIGLSLLVFAYLLLTVLRSLRDDFAPELWRALGRDAVPAEFAQTELLVAGAVLAATAATVVVRDNRRAFAAAIATATLGLLAVAGLLSFDGLDRAPFAYMTLLGVGLYVPYVVVHTTVFERLVAMTDDKGNLGFLMYLADAFGYLGYVGVMFGGATLRGDGDLLPRFEAIAWTVVVAGIASFVLGGAWLLWRTRCARAGRRARRG